MSKEELFSFLKENTVFCREKQFHQKFPSFYEELKIWKFPTSFSFKQKLYHFLNNDFQLQLGICPICGNRCSFHRFNRGYSIHCSKSCMMKDKNVLSKKEETTMKLYNVKNYSQSQKFKEDIKVFYNNRTQQEIESIYYTKRRKTCNEKYDKDSYSQTKDFLDKRISTCIKKYGVESYSKTNEYKERYKSTMIQHYGVEHPLQSKNIMNKTINTCLLKYGVPNYSQTDEYKKKSYTSKKLNNTMSSSLIEKQFSKWLDDNGYNYKIHYKSEPYPFACDFYLLDYDLYIEIQGFWTHGNHPFSKTNPKDMELLCKWKSKNTPQYEKAINDWTIRDVNKRLIAKNHNLNYLEIFSTDINVCVESLLNKLKELK